MENLPPQLLQELCTVFNVDLPCRVKSSQLGIISNKQCNSSAIVKPQPSSCSYICQHCLVHLGDIGESSHSVLSFFNSICFIYSDSVTWLLIVAFMTNEWRNMCLRGFFCCFFAFKIYIPPFSIARYRNQTSQAESYYRHAAQLVPSNGRSLLAIIY